MSAEPLAFVGMLAPILGLLCAALVVLLLDLARPDRTGRVSGGLALAGVACAAVLAMGVWPGTAGAPPGVGYDGSPGGALVLDRFGIYAGWIVLVAAACSIAVSLGNTARWRMPAAEYFALVLVAAGAMMAVVLANDLIVLFLLLETFSLALYVLCASAAGSRPGLEAAVKYFVVGSVAGAFLLYGAAMAYAATGSAHLDRVGAAVVSDGGPAGVTALAGLALLIVGLGFKAALVPFHHWAPDVYEGAPTPVTGFMAAAVKAATFAALTRVLWTGFAPFAEEWTMLLASVAVASMLLGNLAALVQSDIKRMLGYGAIAQAGYVMAAILAGEPDGVSAGLFYLLAYALMNVGAIAVLVGLGAANDGRDATRLDDLRGLARRHPGLALCLAVFMLAMIGLPPTAGFVGKWFIFDALVGAGRTPLAVAVMLNSVLSAFYYFRPVLYAYAGEARSEEPISVAAPVAVVLTATAMVMALGILFAAPLVQAARSAGELGAAATTSSERGPTQDLFFTAPQFEKRSP